MIREITHAALFLTIGVTLSPRLAHSASEDDPLLFTLLLDQLETRDFGDDSAISWDMQGWLGKDLKKLWIKTEGQRNSSTIEDAELQLRYSQAVAKYWDFQVGLRHDFKPSPSRDWIAIGFNGLAPYFFEIDSAVYIGESGQTAFRFTAEYELLLTQRLILTPDIEFNIYGQNDPTVGTGSGLSDIEAGLRLRYEIRREIAPYIGVNWWRKFGDTADFGRAAGEKTTDTQFVLGMRAWF